MGRIFTFLCLLVIGTASLFAQEIITGAVIDSKGVPIPGARVEVVERSEYAVTDIDGRFRIELPVSAEKIYVQYVGFNSVTQDVKPDMVVVLNKGWWRKPEKYQYFVGLMFTMGGYYRSKTKDYYNGDYSYPDMDRGYGLGVMAGMVKNVGFYVEGFMSPKFDNFYSWSLIGGCIVRLWGSIYMYSGLGYTYSKCLFSNHHHSDYYYETNNGLTIDCGLMLRGRYCAAIFGATFTVKEENALYFGNWGVSYFF